MADRPGWFGLEPSKRKPKPAAEVRRRTRRGMGAVLEHALTPDLDSSTLAEASGGGEPTPEPDVGPADDVPRDAIGRRRRVHPLPKSIPERAPAMPEPFVGPSVPLRRRLTANPGQHPGTYRRTGPVQIDLPDGQVWDPLTHAHPDASLDRRMYFEAVIRDTLSDDHPCLGLLQKENRRRWLAYMAAAAHKEERVVSMGEGMGFDIVRVATLKPNFAAMELLQRMEGDFATAGVNVTAGEGSRVLLLVADNGRGPTPVGIPEESHD